MKKLIIILFCLSALSHSMVSAQNKCQYGALEISLYDFESDDGNVRIHLYNSSKKQFFPNKSHEAFKLLVLPIVNRKVVAVFDSLSYGEYAITAHHDANLNVKMDLNFFGLPKEGWGLSKNVLPIFSLPDFEECSIMLDKPLGKVNIKIRN